MRHWLIRGNLSKARTKVQPATLGLDKPATIAFRFLRQPSKTQPDEARERAGGERSLVGVDTAWYAADLSTCEVSHQLVTSPRCHRSIGRHIIARVLQSGLDPAATDEDEQIIQ